MSGRGLGDRNQTVAALVKELAVSLALGERTLADVIEDAYWRRFDSGRGLVKPDALSKRNGGRDGK